MKNTIYFDPLEIKEKTIEEYAAAYYRGERISNALLFLMGSGALFWTFFLFWWRQGNLSTGLFISTLPFALFYIITGLYRFIRSLNRFNSIKNEQLGFLNEEMVHLEERSSRFRRKRKFDLLGVMIGFGLIVISIILESNHIFLATAISILGFSSFLLVFDLFGQFRTEEWLRRLSKN